MAVTFISSIALKRWSVTRRLRVSMEWYLLLPLWCLVRQFLSDRKEVHCCNTCFSATLDSTGRSEIGLLLSGTSWSPFLRWGTTSAFFQARGKMDDSNSPDIVLNANVNDVEAEPNIWVNGWPWLPRSRPVRDPWDTTPRTLPTGLGTPRGPFLEKF